MSTKLTKSGVLIQTKSIRTPDNFAALLADPRVKRLAASIKGVTQIAPIVVQAIEGGAYKLWAGHDRFAAVTLTNKQTIRADIRTGSDADFLLLQIAENDNRRHRADLIEAFEAEVGTNLESVLPAQRVKEKQNAGLAEAQGVTVAAVKKARQRAAKKDSSDGRAKTAAEGTSSPGPGAGSPDAAGVATGEDAQPFTLDLLGLEDASARAIEKYARRDQEAIDEADKYLRLAQTALARMTECTPYQQLKAQVHRVAAQVRSHRPEFICPWCKGLPVQSKACLPCGGLGHVTDEVCGRAPAELTNGPTLVAIDGKFIPYVDAKAGKLPGANGAAKKPAKQNRVVDENDNEIPLDADEAY